MLDIIRMFFCENILMVMKATRTWKWLKIEIIAKVKLNYIQDKLYTLINMIVIFLS